MTSLQASRSEEARLTERIKEICRVALLHQDAPIFQNLANDVVPTGPNQLWVADITYIAIAAGFVYLAAILDAWSRRAAGYAISRRVDARLAVAALRAAVASRQPPKGCIHHSDRGSQYAAEEPVPIAWGRALSCSVGQKLYRGGDWCWARA
jgi:putative transposase